MYGFADSLESPNIQEKNSLKEMYQIKTETNTEKNILQSKQNLKIKTIKLTPYI